MGETPVDDADRNERMVASAKFVEIREGCAVFSTDFGEVALSSAEVEAGVADAHEVIAYMRGNLDLPAGHGYVMTKAWGTCLRSLQDAQKALEDAPGK